MNKKLLTQIADMDEVKNEAEMSWAQWFEGLFQPSDGVFKGNHLAERS